MKFYEAPEMEVTAFAAEDIITISITVGDADEEATVSAW